MSESTTGQVKRDFLVERQGRQFVLYAGLLDLAHQEGLRAIRTKLIQVPTPENGQTAICSAEVETERGAFAGIGDAAPENVSRMMLPHLIRMAETRAKARALRDAVNVGTVAVEEMGEDIEPGGRGISDLGQLAREAAPRDQGQPRAQTASPGPAQASRTAGSTQTSPAPARPAPGAPGAGPADLGTWAAGSSQRPAAAPAAGAGVERGTIGAGAAEPLATPAQVRAIYNIGRDRGLGEAAVDERARVEAGVVPAELSKRQASELITRWKAEPR